jgi:hypothetical protein
MTANQTWVDGGRGIKDTTRLCITSIAVGVEVGAALWVGIIFAAMSVVSCSHLPDLPDLPGTTTTTTTTTTTQPPAASDDAVPMASLTWNRGGINHSRAQRDPRVIVTSARISGTTLTYAGTGLTVWPVGSQGENINGVLSIFYDHNKDGTYERGGKVDWTRSDAAHRPLHHVDHGYSNWDGYPPSGTPWAAVITDEAGKQRSNIFGGIWP